jgi:MFS family permease
MSRIAFLALVFFHGAFAGGMVPVLNAHLGERAPWAFALYFTGMVVGQGSVFRIGRLSLHRFCLAHWEFVFATGLTIMALFPTTLGFLVGRSVEGLGSGLSLPILFARAVRLPNWGTAEKRIGLMNSAFAIGFVSGPSVITAMTSYVETWAMLGGFAACFVAAAVGVGPDVRHEPEAKPTWIEGGLRLLIPMLVAKVAYGFLLATIGGHAASLFPGVRIIVIMFGLAGVVVVGQITAAILIKRFGARLALGALVVHAAGATTAAATGSGLPLVAAALGQSILLLVGYRNFRDVPSSARTFALYNVLSDPGMVVGATLALGGTYGAFGLAAISLVAAGTLAKTPKPQLQGSAA